MPVTQEEVMSALKQVYDPEIPVNIVDLGLIYDVRFESAPGHQAQVDFASFTLPWGRRYALLVVLGYSRLLWLHFLSPPM